MARRLLIVEEALKDFVGHWYEYVRAVAELARKAGDAVTIVGNVRAEPALRDGLGVVPLFERSPWDGDYRRGSRLPSFGLLRHNALVFRRMAAFLRDRPRFDLLFAPTMVLHHVLGWRLLWTLRRAKIGRLVLLVRNNVAVYAEGSDVPRFGAKARLFGWGLRSFASHVATGRVTFATDSARLADEYRALTGLPFVVFPSPRVAPPLPRAPRHRNDAVHFACLGPARFEKGIDVLQRAIALYLADPAAPPARFTIQWPNAITDGEGRPYPPDPALAGSGAVAFLTEPLDSAAYDALLAATDAMVLPYRRSSYFARISGVAVEAVTAGIPVVTTEGTWTAELVAGQGAGLTCPDGDAAALAGAMAELARDYPRFAAAAEAARGRAQAANDGAAFLAALWGEGVSPGA